MDDGYNFPDVVLMDPGDRFSRSPAFGHRRRSTFGVNVEVPPLSRRFVAAATPVHVYGFCTTAVFVSLPR